MKTKLLLLCSLILFFSGCASYKAKSYLMNKEYDKGIALTTKELKDDPNSTYMNYYHGRFLINQKKYSEAIKYFKIAANSFPYKTYHKFWLGVAYGKNKEYDKEIKVYQEILEKKAGRYKLALVYLGKNYYRTKEYDKAIETFQKAFDIYRKPHSYMYYYYAASLMKKGSIYEAKKYFKEYLKTYPTYSLAKYAAYKLQMLNDFEYSNFKIGDKTLTLKNIKETDDFEYYAKKSLKILANELIENKNLILYVVSYDKNSLKLAEKKAKDIKKYILNEYPDINFSDIKIAWFKSSKKLEVDKKSFEQEKYINFFTKNKKG